MPRGRPRKTNKDVLVKSAELIGWALGGLEREILQTRERLASLTAQAARLRERVGRGRGAGVETAIAAASFDEPGVARRGARGGRRRRRKMSAEARRRISERMKKRWADYRKKKAAATK